MATATENAISDILKRQERLIATTEYSVLGLLAIVHTEKGAMEFGKSGPLIGRAIKTGELLLIGGWHPLRPIHSSTDKFCPDCLTKCDECSGKGQRICTRIGCGGAGKIAVGSEKCTRCDGEGIKRMRHSLPNETQCEDCKGHGLVKTLVVCDVCKGTGKAPCALCRGTGKRPTGALRGSTRRDAPACPSCHGFKRQGAETPQKWTRHAQGLLEGTKLIAIGPVRSLILHGSGGLQNNRMRHVVFQPDENGKVATLLVADPDSKSKAYLVGGIPVIRD
jgi:hypothetical protein